MTVVQLTTDNREPFRQYERAQPWFGAAPTALLQGFSECPDVHIHVLSCTQRRMTSSPAKLAENVCFHSLHVPKWGWLRSGYLGCIGAIRRKVRMLRPDIVHGQGTERECALGAAFSGFPNVTTIHGNMAALAEHFRAPIATYYWLAARLEDFSLRRTDGVLCNSAYTENLVRSRTPRTWRVANAVRKEFLAESGPRPFIAVPVILNVGVISARKRQCELLACARRLYQRGVRLRWDFCGSTDASDSYAVRFLTEIREAESAGYARHLGTQSTSEMVRCYDEASALVHFPTEEAFGLVAAEALARNLKFFGSDLGGLRDIANGIEGAELFPLDGWQALEEAIARWQASGCVTPERAAQTMRERYAPSVIARQHLQIYRKVLNTRA